MRKNLQSSKMIGRKWAVMHSLVFSQPQTEFFNRADADDFPFTKAGSSQESATQFLSWNFEPLRFYWMFSNYTHGRVIKLL